MPSELVASCGGVISLIAVVLVPAALADQVFHTSHAPRTPSPAHRSDGDS